VLWIIVTSDPISSMTLVYNSPSGNFLNSLISRFDFNELHTLPASNWDDGPPIIFNSIPHALYG
jgi:hypothetical protein